MTTSSDARDSLDLTALLSALFVAFTIEFDNTFENRMPHRTTNHGKTLGPGPKPWLVSMAMWVLVMRLVPEEGIPTRDLIRRSQLDAKNMRGLVQRLGKWWGYLEVSPDPAHVVRPTEAGRMAQGVWSPLTDEIEGRWNDRFGQSTVDDLREALTTLVARLDVELPDYLGHSAGLTSQQVAGGDGRLSLSALLSKVLQALAMDFDGHSDLALDVYTGGVGSRLPICANVLRLLGGEADGDGVAVSELPARSGVGQMSVDNWIGILDKRGYVAVATETVGRRRRLARLTDKGTQARDAYLAWTESLDGRWPTASAKADLRRVRRAAEAIAGKVGPGSPLWEGIEPYPDGWRSEIPPRQVLPHFPVVSHRGGFPDGT